MKLIGTVLDLLVVPFPISLPIDGPDQTNDQLFEMNRQISGAAVLCGEITVRPWLYL